MKKMITIAALIVAPFGFFVLAAMLAHHLWFWRHDRGDIIMFNVVPV